jgi:hypothetical protein
MKPEQTGRPCYWLLADDQLPLCRREENLDLFVAHFKHNLLFNDRVLFADSQVVNNANLRRAFRTDWDLRELVTADTVTLAARDTLAREPRMLLALRDEFTRTGRANRDVPAFDLATDLEQIEDRVSKATYSLPAISRLYTENVIRIFASRPARTHLGDAAATAICAILQEERERSADRVILKAFIFYRLEGELSKRGLGDVWARHEGDIKALAEAPYNIGIPQLILADPVYAEQHSRSFEILRNTDGELAFEPAGQPIEWESRYDLHSYRQALARLDAATIFRLRESDEYRAFRTAMAQASTEADLENEVLRALARYQERIDHHVLELLGGRARPSGDRHRVRALRGILRAKDAWDVGQAVLGLVAETALANPLFSLFLTLGGIRLGDALGRRLEEEARKEQRYALVDDAYEADRLKKRWEAEMPGAKLARRDVVARRGLNETFYRQTAPP